MISFLLSFLNAFSSSSLEKFKETQMTYKVLLSNPKTLLNLLRATHHHHRDHLHHPQSNAALKRSRMRTDWWRICGVEEKTMKIRYTVGLRVIKGGKRPSLWNYVFLWLYSFSILFSSKTSSRLFLYLHLWSIHPSNHSFIHINI